MQHFSTSLPRKSSLHLPGSPVTPNARYSHLTSGSIRTIGKIISILLLSVAFATAGKAYAASATTTTLQATGAGGSVPSGSVVTLTANVVSGAIAVSPGTVNFCDITQNVSCTPLTAIGSAQLTTAGIASIKTRLGVGAHSLVAVFSATNLYMASTSAPSALTVTGAASYPTTTSLSFTTGTPSGSYNLAAAVTGTGSYALPAPTGTVRFLNTSNGNAPLASAFLATAAGNSTVSFSSPLTASANYTVAIADVNGDGILDLITQNSSGTTATVLLGNGDGTFQTLPSFAVGSPTLGAGVVIGDFNSDGKLDLAVTSNAEFLSSDTLSVMLGNGDGTFQPAIGSNPVNPLVWKMVIGDVNGDGILDIISITGGVTECQGCSISVSLGNGDGTFQPQVVTELGIRVDGVAIGDFNHDGKLDLALCGYNGNGSSGALQVFLGNGDGTFQLTTIAGPDLVPSSLAEGDFNGDGKIDLAMVANTVDSEGSYLSVMLGNGDGTFQTPVNYIQNIFPQTVLAGDFNSDGKVDLLVNTYTGTGGTQTVSLLMGNGDGTFQAPQTLNPGAVPSSVADFNGDGKLDLLSGPSNLLLNTGGPTAIATASGVSIPGSGPQLVLASYEGDTANGASTSSTVSIPGSGAPITWANPAQITYGTALSATQLNATSPAQGTFVYSPAAGTVLSAGTHTLSVTFTPNNSSGYTSSTPTVSITVNQAPVVLTVNNTARVYGAANPTFTGTITGVVSGDTLRETFSTTATPASIVGTYPIVPSFTGSAEASYYPSPTNGVLTVSQAGSATTIALSNNNTTLTATVTSLTGGSPTGNVGFYEGQTLVGTSPLVGGTASFSTTSAPAGNAIITAEYSGDANFTQSASPATQILGISPASTSLTVSQAGTVTDTIRIAPAAGTVGTIQLSCSGLPQAATCSFQPASITLGGTNTPTSVVLTIQTGTSTTARLEAPQRNKRGNFPLVFAAIFWIPGGIAAAIKPRKGKGSSKHRQLLLLALLIGLGGMTACSGSSASSSNSSTPKGTSTVQVTAAGSGSLTQTVSLTLSVQ